jgi:hypothetical protein
LASGLRFWTYRFTVDAEGASTASGGAMTRPIRVIQWATGSMGRSALRRVIEHPDLELVGVHVYDERKVGVDAGTLARRPPTGVRASESRCRS